MPPRGYIHCFASLLALLGLMLAQPGMGVALALAAHGHGHAHEVSISWQDDGVQVAVDHCHHHRHHAVSEDLEDHDTCPTHVFHVCIPSAPAIATSKVAHTSLRPQCVCEKPASWESFSIPRVIHPSYHKAEAWIEPWQSRLSAARALRSIVLLI